MSDISQLPLVVFKNGEIDSVPDNIQIIVLQNYYYNDFMKFMWESMSDIIDLETFKEHYSKSKLLRELNSGRFFVGPFWHDDILMNITLIVDRKTAAQAALIGISFTTALCWSGTNKDLPNGWQGSIKKSYEDKHNNKTPDTLVALGITIEEPYKQYGWATKMIECMKTMAQRMLLKKLIFPLMPPQRYLLEYASMPFEEFAYLKREDGQYQDHWIRTHTQMGAKILKCTPNSHRWIFSRKEFINTLQPQSIKLGDVIEKPWMKHFSKTGKYLVLVMDRWYEIFVLAEYDMVIIDQGGVWVEHSL